MKQSSRSTGIYDIYDSNDLDALNHLLNPWGIHFETDLFDRPYVVLEGGNKLFSGLGQSPRRKKTSKQKRKTTKSGVVET